jgi:hypothetical protein
MIDVVIPTIGRPSLFRLIEGLRPSLARPEIAVVYVVDDRPHPTPPLVLPGVHILRSGGRGPAAARNLGWKAGRSPWIAFLDDDVVIQDHWLDALLADLAASGPGVAGNQAHLQVPLPTDRAPTDWERNVAALEQSAWITADMAYRRTALEQVDGFDERFPRAYREDSDLALRLVRRGWTIACGDRETRHPVGDASPWTSVRKQAGNADDVLMRALHGRGWRRAAGASRGRLPWHALTTAAGLIALGAWVGGKPRLAALSGAGWLAGTLEFAWRRIAPGPRTAPEVGRMLATSAVLPAAACWHALRGWAALPALLADEERAPRPQPSGGHAPDLDHAPAADLPSCPAQGGDR